MKLTRTNPWRRPWEELQAVDYFSALSDEACRRAYGHVDRVEVTEGTVLQRQGMATVWLWIPTSGLLQLRRDGEPAGIVLPGAAYGERELLLGGPSPVEVIAAWPSTVLSMEARAWHALMDVPSFAAAVARRMARVRELTEPRVHGDRSTIAV